MCFSSGVTKQVSYKWDLFPARSGRCGLSPTVPHQKYFAWAKANMPTSTNMQSSTHLPLLVVVVVMARKRERERDWSLCSRIHPSSPPTEDVMQRKKAERRGKGNSKQHVGHRGMLSKEKRKANMFRLCGFLQVRESSVNSTRHADASQTQKTVAADKNQDKMISSKTRYHQAWLI